MGEKIEFFQHEGRMVGAVRLDRENAGENTGEGLTHFLVVDDLPVHRGLLSSLLKVLYPEATEESAGDGLEAMKKLQEHDYSMVLCDWIMPEMDGEALVRWIRAESAEKRLPFVMVSAKDDRDEIMRAFLELNIDGYLVKPLSKAGVADVVSAVLKQIS